MFVRVVQLKMGDLVVVELVVGIMLSVKVEMNLDVTEVTEVERRCLHSEKHRLIIPTCLPDFAMRSCLTCLLKLSPHRVTTPVFNIHRLTSPEIRVRYWVYELLWHHCLLRYHVFYISTYASPRLILLSTPRLMLGDLQAHFSLPPRPSITFARHLPLLQL